MQIIAQQWLVYDLTRSAAWLGIVSGASALPYVVFSMWGGLVADRHPRRSILVLTQALSMIFALLLAALATNRWIPVQPWQVAVLAGCSGIVNAFNAPAQQAFVTEMVEDRAALGNAIALNSLQFNSGRVLGPAIAGAVLVKLGAPGCFALNAVSYLAVIASLLLIRLPAFVPHHRDLAIAEGFAFIWRIRSVLRVFLLIAISSLGLWSAATLFPVFAGHFHRGAAGFSAMMSVNGVGAALGGFFVASLGSRFPRRLLLYGGACFYAGALLFLAAAPSFPLALVSLFLSGFAMIVLAVNANTKVQEEVPDALRGRVMAVYALLFGGLVPLGGLEIGFLAEHMNASAAVRTNAGICLVAVVVIFVWSQVDRPVPSSYL